MVIVGTKCTLRCKDCSNLMQFYSKPYDLDIENVIMDLMQFFSIVDYCVCVNVVGGEPFIYPHLDMLLEYLIHNIKVGSIEITTNATKIPDKGVLELLKDTKVRVEVSDYGCIGRMAEFIKVMDKYQIKIHVSVDMKWIDCGNQESRNREQDLLEKLYMSCRSAKVCKSLFKGRVFDCPRAAHLMDLGYADDIAFLDIYNCSKEDILSFWLKGYTRACDYCDMSVQTKKYVEPAVQMNGSYLERSSCTLIPRNDYEEIWNANEWYKEQLSNYQRRVTELEAWINELQEAKNWLEEKYKSFMETNK